MKTIESQSIEYFTPPSISNLAEDNGESSSTWSNLSSSILVSWSGVAQSLIQYTSSPVVLSESDRSINDSISNLRSTVELISSKRSFVPRSLDFEALLALAASKQGTPADVSEWANKLTLDIANLTD